MDSLQEQYEEKYAEIGRYHDGRAKEILREEAENVVEYKFFIGVKLMKISLARSLLLFKSMNRYLQKLADLGGNAVDGLMNINL